jgi:hypothetical protein
VARAEADGAGGGLEGGGASRESEAERKERGGRLDKEEGEKKEGEKKKRRGKIEEKEMEKERKN